MFLLAAVEVSQQPTCYYIMRTSLLNVLFFPLLTFHKSEITIKKISKLKHNYSPNCSLYISYGADKENLFNNQELL